MKAAWYPLCEIVIVIVCLLIAGEVASGGDRIDGFGE